MLRSSAEMLSSRTLLVLCLGGPVTHAAAAAAKSLQLCPTLCDPIDGSPAPPSLGFSRQEYWSGLPFPSPMHESEKWKWSRSVVSDPQWPHGLQPSRLLCPWDFPGKSTGVGCHCLLRDSYYFFPFPILLPFPHLWFRVLAGFLEHSGYLDNGLIKYNKSKYAIYYAVSGYLVIFHNEKYYK